MNLFGLVCMSLLVFALAYYRFCAMCCVCVLVCLLLVVAMIDSPPFVCFVSVCCLLMCVVCVLFDCCLFGLSMFDAC